MRFTLLVTLFALAGCPDPVDPNVPAAGGPGGELAPMGPNGNPPEGAPPSGDGAPQPAGEGAVPSPSEPSGTPPQPPGFASLVKEGATVTLSGTIEGAKKAQVDFQFYEKDSGPDGKGAPENVEIMQVSDGAFSVKAPATLDRELYITATAKQGEQPSPTDPSGFVGPLKLAGKDLQVTIKLAPGGASKLPWFREGGPPVSGAAPGADGMAPMNAGATPASSGAAPAGASAAAPAPGAAPAADAKAPAPATPPADAKSPALTSGKGTAPKTDAKGGKAPAAPK